MAVTFILGRAGSGKTHACVAGVRAALAEPDSERRLVLLVPEQASFQVERTLALGAPGRGLWRAEVLSFSRLARHVLSATGAPELLGPQARRLALRHVTRARGDALVVLRRAARTQGFFAELDRLIEELIRENVTPDQLRAAAQRVPDQRWAAKAGEVAEQGDEGVGQAVAGEERVGHDQRVLGAQAPELGGELAAGPCAEEDGGWNVKSDRCHAEGVARPARRSTLR